MNISPKYRALSATMMLGDQGTDATLPTRLQPEDQLSVFTKLFMCELVTPAMTAASYLLRFLQWLAIAFTLR